MAAAPPPPVLVVDNGASACRVGFAGQADPHLVAPNATVRVRSQLEPFVADQIEAQLTHQAHGQTWTRPCDRGVITNWPCQLEVWQRLFPLAMAPEGRQPANHTLVVTAAPFTPGVLSRALDEVAFEVLGFGALARRPAPCFSGWHHCVRAHDPTPACLVVDLGFSATHAVPVVHGKAVASAVRRLDIGGKLLTNFLKESVSFRQYNMMDEYRLINHAKEDLCYVAADFPTEAKRTCGVRVPAARAAYREWVLPDYRDVMQGYVRTLPVHERGFFQRTRESGREVDQALKLEVERFAVPELLFTPSDCGLNQAGLPELIAQAVAACEPALQGLLYSNVVLTGGSCRFPGLLARLEAGLRPLVPDHFGLRLSMADDPELDAWRGAAQWAADGALLQRGSVTRAEYAEGGHEYCQARFGPC